MVIDINIILRRKNEYSSMVFPLDYVIRHLLIIKKEVVMKKKAWDIKTINRWRAPEKNGVELLGMPNIPLGLFGQAPRTIMGQSKWDVVRKRCYMDANYTCEICGKHLGHGNCAAHEVYSYDFKKALATFERCVCVCSECHHFIHSGRLLTLYKRQDPAALSACQMMKLAGDRFAMIQRHNSKYGVEPIMVAATFLEWGETIGLRTTMNTYFESFNIKFAKPYEPKRWQVWKLIVNGVEYESKYKCRWDWDKEFGEGKNDYNL